MGGLRGREGGGGVSVSSAVHVLYTLFSSEDRGLTVVVVVVAHQAWVSGQDGALSLRPPTTKKPIPFLPFAWHSKSMDRWPKFVGAGVATQWVVERHANGAAAVNFGVSPWVGVRSEAFLGGPRELVQRRLIRQREEMGE